MQTHVHRHVHAGPLPSYMGEGEVRVMTNGSLQLSTAIRRDAPGAVLVQAAGEAIRQALRTGGLDAMRHPSSDRPGPS